MSDDANERVASHLVKTVAISSGLCSTYTLPETNIEPENRPSQKETSIPTIHFQVLC